MRLLMPAAALACALALCLPHAHARQQGQQQADPSAAEQVRPTNINTMPFVELAERGRMMAESGRVGWDTTLDMSATAEFNDDGSFKPESVKIVWRAATDEDVTALAQQLLTAIGESRMLGALRGHSKSVRFDARLDRSNLALGLESEFASEADAAQTARGYDMLLLVARKAKAGTVEGELYEALKLTSEGRAFRVVFEMPKAAVAKMVADMLDKRAARRAASPNQE